MVGLGSNHQQGAGHTCRKCFNKETLIKKKIATLQFILPIMVKKLNIALYRLLLQQKTSDQNVSFFIERDV